MIGTARVETSMTPIMRYQLRWILPVAQLSVCLVALWPARDYLLFSVIRAKEFYASRTQETGHLSEPQRVIVLPELTQDQRREIAAAFETAISRYRVPVVLNFPVAVVQVPYSLVTQREWHPQGMLIEAWRALMWPLAGLVFWWLMGRGMEALWASFRSTLRPRLNPMEVTWAILLLAVGIVTLVGIMTSTPDDRRDKDFMALIYGGLLWGVLAGLTVSARFRQWRIYKSKAVGSTG